MPGFLEGDEGAGISGPPAPQESRQPKALRILEQSGPPAVIRISPGEVNRRMADYITSWVQARVRAGAAAAAAVAPGRAGPRSHTAPDFLPPETVVSVSSPLRSLALGPSAGHVKEGPLLIEISQLHAVQEIQRKP
ncbi:hypothetical protein SKAU_G00185450 [Synaphobranchus kaupii]|uniref:Uncharacterized protein n=1 Tax=Synaphobranchus kaupii TaxID=118154 RepID=A0A9Q1IWD1_SYNKA|nr:hypothetical protein SKAU_G00185450 [Synaphobranchus kaupii]